MLFNNTEQSRYSQISSLAFSRCECDGSQRNSEETHSLTRERESSLVKVDFPLRILPISNSRAILVKEQLEEDRSKLRDESKEDAFASQTARIKKLNHSRDALRYRSFLPCDQMFLCKVACAKLEWDSLICKELSRVDLINFNNNYFPRICIRYRYNWPITFPSFLFNRIFYSMPRAERILFPNRILCFWCIVK